MQNFGTLTRVTKHGHTSTWHFLSINDEYWAIGGCHRPLGKRFDNVDQLRALYSQYVSYGYTPVCADAADAVLSDTQLALAV